VFENGRFRHGTIETDGQRITRVFNENEPVPAGKRADGKGGYVFPAPIDLHIHGVNAFGAETGELLEMSSALAEQGVGLFAPTFYSAPVEILCAQLKKCAALIGKETGARIRGVHLEGPFISPRKTGVMRAADTVAPSVAEMEKLYRAAGGHIFSLTIAPELDGSDEVITWCVQHGILVQIGHTDATYAQTEHAKQLGAHHITHLGNAMRGFHHREPGALGAALMDEDFSCEIIADGFHLSPEVIRFLHRIKPLDKIVLVTDALRPTGQKVPPFFANGDEVMLKDGVWKRVQDGVTAGSALTMLQAMKNLTGWGFTPAEAVVCACVNPARLAGVDISALPLLLTDCHFSLVRSSDVD
jgi:N-acetylglucosamine-6-phosphate deacetylase